VFLPLIFHLPVPHISTMWLVGWFVVSEVLSIAAGHKASRWWFVVSGCFGLTLILLLVAQAVWESGAAPH
jgi:uncharacterized membrane protein HdeD (DUF308 family)